MPANLPPDARKKWAEVEATKHPKEKLLRMEEFLSLVPKHKGTLKLRGQVKKQMSVIRKELEEKKRKKAGRTGPKLFIEKEGAAQVVLLGVTNVGKSCLLAALTRSRVEVSAAPYTTKQAVPGIMNYEDIQFQLLEAPAIMEGAAEGRAWGLQTLALARNADGLVLMVDLSCDPVEQFRLVVGELEKARVLLSKPKARVEVERKFAGSGLRIIVVGRLVDCTFRDVEGLLKSYRITDAVVKISGEAGLGDVEDAIFESTVYKSAVIVANKIDVDGAEGNLKLLKAYVGDKLPIVAVSCEKRLGLNKLGEVLFRTLGIVRVYTKEPIEREYSRKPFILKKGSTVYDLARSIHSDFSENFLFAKVWAKRLTFSPRKVGHSFVLEDGDIVEIHLK